MEDDHPDVTDLPWPLADTAAANALRAELLAAYGEPSRGHHGVRHLTEVLQRLDELATAGAVFDRATVQLAAWFHDAVYDGERDAEERSATWAEEVLPSHLDEASVAEVARLVRLTEHHRPEAEDANGCALSDADLSILASPQERYDEYVAAVRSEYAHLPDDVFSAGRAQVLKALAESPQLFRTSHGHDQWEQAARANLARELATLAVGSPV